MESLCGALSREVPDVEYQGICDLTLGNRKFSGNSLRVARDSVLYHGTLLYDADLDFIARCLKMPPRHPEYRQGRSHEAFLTNIPLSRDGLAAAVWEAFASELPAVVPPGERAAALCATRYDNPEWNFRH
jgi:lipoate-protein ligase A